MEESEVRKIAQEMIKNEVLTIIKEVKTLVLLNLDVGALLLSGISKTENYNGSRREVVELLDRLKIANETIKKRLLTNKDDRQE